MITRQFAVTCALSGFLLLAANACKPAAPPISAVRENCEALLEAMLKSPSSLQIVEVRESDWQGDTKDVAIVYDADNSFGASLRGNLTCSYLSDPDWWTDTKGAIDMRTDTTKPVAADSLMPYKLVSDGETIGGSKIKPDIAILLQKIKAKDVLRRSHEQNK